MKKVEDLITFNEENAELELPRGVYTHEDARIILTVPRIPKSKAPSRFGGTHHNAKQI